MDYEFQKSILPIFIKIIASIQLVITSFFFVLVILKNGSLNNFTQNLISFPISLTIFFVAIGVAKNIRYNEILIELQLASGKKNI